MNRQQPLRHRCRAMNTDIELALLCDADVMKEAALLASDWYEEVERIFSRFRPNSELSVMNRAAGSPVLVSAMMVDILQLAVSYQESTSNVFSPFVGRAMLDAGYDRSYEQLKPLDQGGSQSQRSRACATDISSMEEQVLREPLTADRLMALNPAMKSVQLQPGIRLDLGGIVKSWSTAKLGQWLRERLGIRAGLVNAGGDLQAWNEIDAEPIWQIDLAMPGGRQAGFRMVASGAVATSGTLGRQWETEHGGMHHLIDPCTGRPSRSGIVQCTVAGPDLVASEVWAKTICIRGQDGLRLMREREAEGYSVITVDEQGQVRQYGNGWRFEDTEALHKEREGQPQ